jgi:hypothetical protein
VLTRVKGTCRSAQEACQRMETIRDAEVAELDLEWWSCLECPGRSAKTGEVSDSLPPW